jgi:hypothetical protein
VESGAAAAETELKGRAGALVRQARALGLSREDALRALRDAWKEKGHG